MKQTDKNIKEIRIYHSLWKNILLTVGCFAFAAGGYFILHDSNTCLLYTSDAADEYNPV